MELDQPAISTITAILSSVFSSGVTYGILKGKVESMEKRLEAHEESDSDMHNKFVTFAHFDAVTGHLQMAVHDIQKDIKEILKLLSQTVRGK